MLDDQVILLTGGTGSFGRAFLRRMRAEHPSATVRIYSRDELKQSEVREEFGDDGVRYLIGDIRDKVRLTRAAAGADVIVHAAAMKQVPASEHNPFEAIQTNVIGAQNLVDVAIDSTAHTLVALSTDKAANPVNLYGATKLCMEKLVVQGNVYAPHSGTVLSCVRYGNVMNSRGSVVPVFQRQAAQDGVLTITDERMTRFWITLDQAVDLVLFAIENASGGEIFIPKIPSMRVLDLAEAIAPGVATRTVGIRPGEKLHELLITADEARHTVDASEVYVIVPEHPSWGVHTEWAELPPVPTDFAYDSGTNEIFLTVEQLRALLP